MKIKRPFLALAIVALLSGALVISCNSSSKKLEEAQEDVVDAHNDLDQANLDYEADIENYRLETAAKIEDNNQSIADFKARVASEKKEKRAEYEAKINELDQKNSDMKKKLDDYKIEGKEKWDAFKTEFNSDMNELGTAFKDLTVRNTK